MHFSQGGFPDGTAAAAKPLQSCLSLCNPIDGSPPGSPIPGILQARTQEWVAISFSNAWKWKVEVKSLSRVRLAATPWEYSPGKNTGVGCHCPLHQMALVVKNPPAQCTRCKRCRFDPWVRKITWRRTCQPTPVFFPGKSHGQRSLVGYSPWGHKESDTTEQMNTHTHNHTKGRNAKSVWKAIGSKSMKTTINIRKLQFCLSLSLFICFIHLPSFPSLSS